MREIDGKTALPFSSQMEWVVGSWGWERKGRSWPAARGSPHSKGNQMLQRDGAHRGRQILCDGGCLFYTRVTEGRALGLHHLIWTDPSHQELWRYVASQVEWKAVQGESVICCKRTTVTDLWNFVRMSPGCQKT